MPVSFSALRLGVVGVLVLGSGTVMVESASYAATGHPIEAGGSTHEKSTTVLTRTNSGPALRLATKTGSPPLSVSSTTKVKHLNADLVDGKAASGLGTHSVTYTYHNGTTEFGELDLGFPGLAPGTYLVTWSASPEPNDFTPSPTTPYTFEGLITTTDLRTTAGTVLNDESSDIPMMNGSGIDTFTGASNAPELTLEGNAEDSAASWSLQQPLQVTFVNTTDDSRTPKRITVQ